MSEDENFRRLIRSLYTYLRAFHHEKTLRDGEAQGTKPRRLENIAENLSTAIKPALINTNETTSLWIYANARNWLHFGLDILKDHYSECLEKTQTS